MCRQRIYGATRLSLVLLGLFGIDLLTSREHLEMYARLRGIPESHVNVVVEALMEKVGLKEYADQVTRGYSGGTKRKLSLAIALVGMCVRSLADCIEFDTESFLAFYFATYRQSLCRVLG